MAAGGHLEFRIRMKIMVIMLGYKLKYITSEHESPIAGKCRCNRITHCISFLGDNASSEKDIAFKPLICVTQHWRMTLIFVVVYGGSCSDKPYNFSYRQDRKINTRSWYAKSKELNNIIGTVADFCHYILVFITIPRNSNDLGCAARTKRSIEII